MNEQLSAWLDGELDDELSNRALTGLRRQPAERRACEAYWLIGDCLRGETGPGSDFTARVMQALQEEPVVLAPVATSRPRVVQPPRWMAIAAGSSAVLVVAWAALALRPEAGTTLQTAQTVAATPVGAQSRAAGAVQPTLVRDDRAYLLAHRPYAGGAPMADVAGYIRTVSGDQQQVVGQ